MIPLSGGAQAAAVWVWGRTRTRSSTGGLTVFGTVRSRKECRPR
jgi:hypothetical protein